ncbi:MAG: hypothetical protein Ct9H90mP7_0150 [Candidatus Neomarinimicrobiota bacterium]|nr:MAG: hypothetical protein Ct9H90mP7_0150 [Candidatus Neomarinimicrobiota bacterium]
MANFRIFILQLPNSIGFEIHKPHKSFKMEINDGDKILYGDENRMYFNILFGF